MNSLNTDLRNKIAVFCSNVSQGGKIKCQDFTEDKFPLDSNFQPFGSTVLWVDTNTKFEIHLMIKFGDTDALV